MLQCFKSQTSSSLKHARGLVWPRLIRRLGLPGVAPATPRIARRGCLKHVDAAMLIAWMEKIEKHKRNTRFEKPEPLQSRRATRT